MALKWKQLALINERHLRDFTFLKHQQMDGYLCILQIFKTHQST